MGRYSSCLCRCGLQVLRESEILEQLARTVEILSDEGPPNLFVKALWLAEAPSVTTRVTRSELVELAQVKPPGHSDEIRVGSRR
jgi:hypothetical protein